VEVEYNEHTDKDQPIYTYNEIEIDERQEL